MKKVAFILAIGAIGLFASCKECTTCIIRAGEIELSAKEKCGTERAVSQFEDDQKADAKQLLEDGIDGARAYCTRN